jgi:4-diphosphocytidyl-2C-methyl-D-erythritol kinase
MASSGGRPSAVRVDAHAKLNLGLAVGPRRSDGFHELATVFQSISLADSLIARRKPRGFSLRVRYENAAIRGPAPERIPGGASNLVLHAARRVAQRAGFQGGASFELVKRIPARSGMGGGSADAAAAIVAMDALFRLGLKPADRLAIGLELGSDVPFALQGGTAVGFGRGERLRPARLASAFRAIVAVPRWRVSTARAFAEIDRNKYGLTEWSAKLRFAQSVERKSVSATRLQFLGNTFEFALGRRRKEFVSLCARLEDAGVLNPRLTGSGSAVFGVLSAGIPVRSILSRFEGTESIFVVRSTRRALRLRRRGRT